MRLLINHGANYNAPESDNSTPLHQAVMFDDRPDIVEVLINAGAVMDAWDIYQYTPLLLAAKICYYESVEMLIASGAFIKAIDASG